MADITKTVAIIFQAQGDASVVVGKLANDIRTVGDSANASTGKVDELAKSTEKLADSAKPVTLLTDAMKALAASLVLKAFIEANVEAEKFERAMTLLKGSTDAAAQEFQYITGLTRTLGLSLFDAADAYVSLTAATKGTALEGQATREIFEAVSVAMSSLGKSSAETQGALLAISQIVSKGTVSLEELRGQLGERLPGAFQIAADAMGVTTAELDKLVSSGKLSAEEFLPKFAAALRNTFGDTSYIEGYAASFARLQNEIKLAFVIIGDAGTFDVLTKAVQLGTAAVVGALSSFRLLGEYIGIVAGAIASGNFSDLGTTLDAAFSKAGDSTRSARDALLGFNDEATKTGAIVRSSGGGVNLFAGDVAKYEASQKAATEATNKASLSSKAAVDQLAKQAEQTRKAEEAAAKMALELEKLASNERIKNMEFKVQLDIAQLEADTKRVEAAFDSINNTMNSTGDVISSALGLLKDFDSLDWGAIRTIETQLEKENAIRRENFELQKKLTEAQIANINAQTRNLEKGDAIIKIDGAGLQPHLEAFMWEILRTIQTRVNSQGLSMLLGV